MAKFAKPVSFNEKNEKDRLMLNHVKRRNFSGYVKKLIWEDMNLVKQEKPQNEPPTQSEKVDKEVVVKENKVPVQKKLTASERIEQLKKQTKKQQTSPSPLPFMPSSPRKC